MSPLPTWLKRKGPFLFLSAFFLPNLSIAESDLTFSSWHIYWDQKNVQPATSLYLQKLDHVSLFAVHFDSSGHLISAFPSLLEKRDALKALSPQIKILLTAVNDVVVEKKSRLKDPNIIHDILSDPAKTQTHIQELLTLSAPFDGIEIDYENLKRTDREIFTRFIQQLGDEIHKQGKVLSVIVEPKTTDVPLSAAAAMDWKALSESADFIKIMAYYLHFPSGIPGPVAPTAWVQNIATYALTQIPKEKVVMVLVMNGVDWPNQGKGQTIDYETAIGITQSKNIKLKRDRASKSPYFHYKGDNIRHVVWFEDQTSLNDKIQMLERTGLTRIGLWRLGSGDPSFWRALGSALNKSKPIIK